MQDSLCKWRHGAPYSLHILGFFLFLFGQFLCEWASLHTTHFCFLVQFCALCPKPWHSKHCWIEGVILNSSTLKIMPVSWHISPPEISASACFGLSHFTFMKGRSLPVLFDFILSASAWVILLKSSSCLKSSSDMLLHTPVKTKILSFFCVCRVVWLWKWHFNFFPENLLHFWLALQDGKVFGSILLWKSNHFLSAWFVKLWGLDGTASVRSWF